MLKKIPLLFFLLYTLYFILYTHSYAIEFQSPRFKFDLNQIEVNNEKKDDQATYTIENLFASQNFKEFNSNGFTIFQSSPDSGINLTLSNSLLTVTDLSNSLKNKVILSSATDQELNTKVTFLQESPLKSFNGDTIKLTYSLSSSDVYRPLPEINPGLIISGTDHRSIDLYFKLEAPQQSIDQTYDAIVNFTAVNEY